MPAMPTTARVASLKLESNPPSPLRTLNALSRDLDHVSLKPGVRSLMSYLAAAAAVETACK